MNTLKRAGLLVLLALTLAAPAAFAIDYDDVVGLTREGVSKRTIIELIVKDGRAFEMSDDEVADLRDEDVDEDVIQAMIDPEFGQDWLDGKSTGRDYSTKLDRAYRAGYDDGRTSLVFSFGYYYGPLSRYYYRDPFYYSFWYSGYSASYWPSYCAYYYRPAYAWYSPYPYNWYNYDSYYCYTWYDPGYYVSRGYSVAPGFGRTVWDNGPRWRDGGLPPTGDGKRTALADVVKFRGRPAQPPVIRDLLTRNDQGRRGDLVSGARMRDGSVSRQVQPSPRERQVIRSSDPTRRSVTGRVSRSEGDVRRGEGAGRMTREGRAPRLDPSRDGGRREVSRRERGEGRAWMPGRNDGGSRSRGDGGGSTRSREVRNDAPQRRDWIPGNVERRPDPQPDRGRDEAQRAPDPPPASREPAPAREPERSPDSGRGAIDRVLGGQRGR